ncbi:MAG: DinB family protein [Thermomicrobiales bacterium]
MDIVDRLLDFDEWAMHDLLRASSSLADAQLDQEFDIGHRTVRATFIHLIWNLDFWTSLMTGGDPLPEPDWTGISIAKLAERYDRSFAAFAALARKLRDEERMDEVFVDHWQVKKSMSGTILQVILHASEHRMEITHMLIRLGVQNVPEVDLGARDYELLNC